MALGNMYRKFCEVRTVVLRYASVQTDIQTHLLQYFAPILGVK